MVLSDIAPLVDRIYAQTTEASISALAAAVEAANADTEFVPELTAAPADEQQSYLLAAQS